MIKNIEPRKLSLYLWRTGPYLYFFNAPTDEKNISIILYMSEMAAKYPKIDIFQINWNKHREYNIKTPLNYKNTVFLYFQGKMLKYEFEPTKDKIQELINDYFICHNQKMIISAKKIKSKVKDDYFNKRETSILLHNRYERTHIHYVRKRVKQILKNVIKLPAKPVISEEDSIKESLLKTNTAHFRYKKQKSISEISKLQPSSKFFENLVFENNDINFSSTLLLKNQKSPEICKNIVENYKVFDEKSYFKNHDKWFKKVEESVMFPNDFLVESNPDINCLQEHYCKSSGYSSPIVNNKNITKSPHNMKIDNGVNQKMYNSCKEINNYKKGKSIINIKSLCKVKNSQKESSYLNNAQKLNNEQMVLKYADEVIKLCQINT